MKEDVAEMCIYIQVKQNLQYRKIVYFFFRKTLQIAKQLSDKALEAQACYSLGNTYTLLKDYEKAIEFHMKHLKIAQELEDRVGEGRACWSLGNAHTALGKNEEAIKFASKHLEISREVRIVINIKVSDLNIYEGSSC